MDINKTSGRRKLNPERITKKNEKRRLDPSRISYDSAALYSLNQKSGADTLDRDIEMLHSALGAIGSGWQNKDSMKRRGQELASIQDRLSARRKYLSVAQMFPDDFGITSDQSKAIQRISDLENDFRNISDSFNSLGQVYDAFGSADEYNKAVETQKEYYDKWGHLADEADFDEYVQAGEKTGISPNATAYGAVVDQKNKEYGDSRYEQFKKEKDIENYASISGNIYDQLSDEERGIYNYLLGKNGKEKAGEYLEYMFNTASARKGADTAKKIQGIENPFLNSLAHVGYSIYGGMDQFLSGIASIAADDQVVSHVGYANGELMNDLDGWGKYLYQAGNTVGNMLPSIAISAATGGVAGELLGSASMGISAGGNAYGQALAEGYSKEQARAYGVLVGASEGALQYALGGIKGLGGKLGLGKIGNLAEKAAKIDNALLRISAKLGANILDETIEEELQNFLEPAFRAILFDEEYDAPTVEELVETAIVTALSTGAMSGPSTIANDNRVNTFKDAQLDMQYSGQGEAWNAALEKVLGKERAAEVLNGSYLPTVRETKAIQKESGVSSEQIQSGLNEYGTELVQEAEEIKPGSRQAAKIRKEFSQNDGKVTGRSIDNLTRENESVMRERDKPAIRDTAGERLAELGEAREQIPVIASAISKQVAGEKLTAQERKAIDGSKYGIRVANELNPENVGTGLYSNAYLDDIEPTQFYNSYYDKLLQQKQYMEEAKQRVESDFPYVSYAPENADSTVDENIQEQIPTESENAPESAGNDVLEQEPDVSADGQTILKDTGETVQIKQIASTKNGSMKLSLDNGKTVDARDVSYASPEEAILYETIAGIEASQASANALIKNYNPADGVSAEIYARGIAEAYRYGNYGVPMQEMRTDTFAADLTPAQREFAYKLGQMDREYSVNTAQKAIMENKNKSGKKKTGQVYFERGVQPQTERQKVSVQAMEKVSEALGVDIHFFASKVDAKGKRIGDNGWYDPQDGSIHIDIHAGMTGEGTILFTASHELVHFMRQWSPAKFKVLADFLFAEYGKKGISVDAWIREQKNRAKEAGRDISYDTAYEEVVARSCEKLLADGAAVEKLAKLKARDKSVWQKIKEYITELAGKIRKAYEGLLPDSAEGRYVAQMKDTMERLQELFIEGISDAGANYKAAQGSKNAGLGKKYSVRDVNGNSVVWIEDNILKENKGLPTHQFIANYIAEHIGDVYTIIESGQRVYIGKDLPGEYTQSKYTKQILRSRPGVLKVKQRSVVGIGEMIEIATNRRWEKTRHTKSKDAKYGMYRYDTKVAFPVWDSHGNKTGANVYDAELVIRNASDGKKYLYDIVNIKKDNTNSDWLTQRTIRATEKAAAQKGEVSADSIPSKSENVKRDSEEKFSTRDPDLAMEFEKEIRILEKENARLREDKEALRELAKLQRQLTHGVKFTKTSLLTAARLLKKNTNAVGDTKQLVEILSEFYGYIASSSGQNMTWDDVAEAAQPAVDWLMENGKGVRYTDEHVQEALGDIRKSRIYLDDVQKSEVENTYGSYDSFRKQAMGSVILSKKDSVSLDTKWQEWSMLYPEYFDAEVVPADMPAKLMETIATLRNSKEIVSTNLYSPEMTKQEILAEVYDSYWMTSTMYTAADVAQREINRLKLKHMQRMDELRQDFIDLKKEHQKKTAQLRKKYKEESVQKQAEIIARYTASRKKGIENRKKTAKRGQIKRVASELENMLLHGTKERNVKIGMQKPVAELLDAFNMDTVDAKSRIAEYDKRIEKETDTAKREKLIQTRERIRLQGENVGKHLTQAKAEYAKFKNSDDPLIADSYDEVIDDYIGTVAELVGDTPLRNMSLEQLEAVYKVFKMVLTAVRSANKTFKMGRDQTVADLGEAVCKEILAHKGSPLSLPKVFDNSIWNSLKPIYAARAIGSDTIIKLLKGLDNGEDVWARDGQEAREFNLKTQKEFGYSSWDFKTKYEFKDKTGSSFSLALNEMFTLYALSKREQAKKHLLAGGLVLESKNKLSPPFVLTQELIDGIAGKLTKEQKAFVEKMQKYLSEVMGAKGNEVTLQLYGIKLFGEEYYFPVESSDTYVRKAESKTKGEFKIKNASMTKEVNPNANNPIVVRDFMDIWSEHVNKMAMYHAFVLPLEDFTRVFNYKTGPTSEAKATSVRAALESTYGKGVTAYINNLLSDLNGGVRNQGGTEIPNKMVSMTKKGAVLASWSVTVQQPSAIMRACAHINPKYLAAAAPAITNYVNFKGRKKAWEECKKYAPVAIIKEMGYFDTGMGKSSADWIKADSTFFEKVDDGLAKLPSIADEATWVYIWEAVKKEVADKESFKTKEDFLKRAGERFTEVIRLTQVYDSTLSRSGFMRSKDGIVKMATAFMAEPTVTMNMLVDAAIQGKRVGGIRGAKKVAGTVGAIVSSTLLNSILKSVITAMRDDDEDKTYLEKYLGDVYANFLDDINPLSYLPFVKDAVSIFTGYDVSRMDMTLISDLKRAIDALGSDKKSFAEKVDGLTGAVSAFLGVPYKNVSRDIQGIINTVKSFASDNKTTKVGIEMAIEEAHSGKKNSDGARIWKYYSSGEVSQAQTHIQRVIEEKMRGGADEDEARGAVRTSVNSYIKPLYLDAYASGNEDEAGMICDLMDDIDIYENAAKTRRKWIKDAKKEVAERAWKYYSTGKTSKAVECVRRAIQIREQEGATKQEAEAAVLKDMSALLESLYVAAHKANNDERMCKIRYLMRDIGIYGSAGAAVDVCVNWVKEAYK